MRKIILITSVVTSLLISTFTADILASSLEDQAREQIQLRISQASKTKKIDCGSGLICKSPMLSIFYIQRDFRPAWIANDLLRSQAEILLKIIQEADHEGLKPEDYHLYHLERSINDWRQLESSQKFRDIDGLVKLDFLLTDALLHFGFHLQSGRVDYKRMYPEWSALRKYSDLTYVLRNALESGDIENSLRILKPRYTGYDKLKALLNRYQNIAENVNWQAIPRGSQLTIGDKGVRVSMLRKRLAVLGDLDFMEEGKSQVFDQPLEDAVRKFQRRHGIKSSGRVGIETLEALNAPIKKRISQIKLNMDRLRWLPDDIGRNYILANIADFSLELIDDDQVIMDMRIIIGNDKQRSFIFSDEITYLELNPFWNIPDSIALKEELPKIRKNPQYLSERQIKILKDWSDRAKEIKPDSILWSQVNIKNFQYKLRQEPGPKNPLGRIKFMFPNKFEVYLHDTPNRSMFKKKRRNLSHGCIRIEKPIDLATYLLRNKEGWSHKKILSEIKKAKRQVVMLPEAVPIHIVYWTAWVDRNGILQFRDDIYKMDTLWDRIPEVESDLF